MFLDLKNVRTRLLMLGDEPLITATVLCSEDFF